MKEIVVLSLFDGMSCGQIALTEMNFPIKKYYASEVDKHAIGQTKLNFPNTIHLGDVRNIDISQLDLIDILIGGSPCQSFSFAGKQKGMATKSNEEVYTLDRYLELKADGFEFEGQSYLFWEYMRILNDIRKYNPDVLFLLENVEMVAKWKRTLSQAIGIWPVHINSALVSAQNRKRLYWTNIRTRKEGLFGDLYSDIPQPKDRGILLKDILQPESDVHEKYYLSDKGLIGFIKGVKGTLKRGLDKSGCLTAGAHSGGNHSDMDIICVSMVGRKTNENGVRKDNDPSIKAVQRLEPNINGKTNCLTSVQKDNLVMQLNPSIESGGKQPYMQNRVYDIDGINPALTTLWNGSNLINTSRLRRLTPLECSRLQTIPDWYKWGCSDTQQYKMLSNGWTVEVIKHIFSFIKFEK